MRDPNRIDPFLKTLGDYWKKYPDLRFNQMIYNLNYHYGHPIPDALIGFAYQLEDDLLEELIKSKIK